jgi:hypothetical protein
MFEDRHAIHTLLMVYAERIDGTWRFAERVYVSHLVGDLSAYVG